MLEDFLMPDGNRYILSGTKLSDAFKSVVSSTEALQVPTSLGDSTAEEVLNLKKRNAFAVAPVAKDEEAYAYVFALKDAVPSLPSLPVPRAPANRVLKVGSTVSRRRFMYEHFGADTSSLATAVRTNGALRHYVGYDDSAAGPWLREHCYAVIFTIDERHMISLERFLRGLLGPVYEGSGARGMSKKERETFSVVVTHKGLIDECLAWSDTRIEKRNYNELPRLQNELKTAFSQHINELKKIAASKIEVSADADIAVALYENALAGRDL